MEYRNAVEELADVLANRFARLSRGWEASRPGDRLDSLEHILAGRHVAARLVDLITESDAAFLLKLDDPLKAVADQWLEATGLSQSQDDTLLRCVETLRDSTLQQDIPKKQKSPRRSSMTR